MGSFAGPNIIKDSLYNYHIATTSGVFTPNFSGNIEVLVVAGGGGGGVDMGGGGGAGGLIYKTAYPVVTNTAITVTIGGGGAGAVGSNASFNACGNGGNGSCRLGGVASHLPRGY